MTMSYVSAFEISGIAVGEGGVGSVACPLAMPMCAGNLLGLACCVKVWTDRRRAARVSTRVVAAHVHVVAICLSAWCRVIAILRVLDQE
jgi:hypothetical protein